MNQGNAKTGIDGGKIVIALGAILLLASLFVDWYGFGDGGPHDGGFTAWTAFELVDLLLALLAVAAIAAALEPVVRGRSHLPTGTASAAGPVALLLVVVSIINVPPAAQGFDSELEVGAWLALAGAAIMCAGALLAFNRISLVVTPRERTTDIHAAETRTQPTGATRPD